MTKPTDPARDMARKITEARTTCQWSRQEFGRMLAQAGVAKSAAWRLETKGTVTRTELDVLRKILTERVVDLRRCADEVTDLVKHLPTMPTVVVEAAEELEPKPTPRKGSPKPAAKKTAPIPRRTRKTVSA